MEGSAAHHGRLVVTCFGNRRNIGRSACYYVDINSSGNPIGPVIHHRQFVGIGTGGGKAVHARDAVGRYGGDDGAGDGTARLLPDVSFNVSVGISRAGAAEKGVSRSARDSDVAAGNGARACVERLASILTQQPFVYVGVVVAVVVA